MFCNFAQKTYVALEKNLQILPWSSGKLALETPCFRGARRLETGRSIAEVCDLRIAGKHRAKMRVQRRNVQSDVSSEAAILS